MKLSYISNGSFLFCYVAKTNTSPIDKKKQNDKDKRNTKERSILLTLVDLCEEFCISICRFAGNVFALWQIQSQMTPFNFEGGLCKQSIVNWYVCFNVLTLKICYHVCLIIQTMTNWNISEVGIDIPNKYLKMVS